MYPPEVRSEIRRLVALGVNDCEISRRLGVPRTTVRDIRRPTHVPREQATRERCLRCWMPTKPVHFDDALYAYVLGLYLGDGTIVTTARTCRLRIFMDAKYPGIVEEARIALSQMFPANTVGVFRGHRDGGCR